MPLLPPDTHWRRSKSSLQLTALPAPKPLSFWCSFKQNHSLAWEHPPAPTRRSADTSPTTSQGIRGCQANQPIGVEPTGTVKCGDAASGVPRTGTADGTCALRNFTPCSLCPPLLQPGHQLHLAALLPRLRSPCAQSTAQFTAIETGLVFNFLINTLYIKEKGLQFAVSTQRARGGAEKKKIKKLEPQRVEGRKRARGSIPDPQSFSNSLSL